VLSLVLYILVSLALLPVALPGVSRRLALFSCLGTLVLACAGTAFVILQRRNPCISLLHLLQRVGACPAVLAAKEPELASLDSYLAGFYRDHPRAGVLALLFYFLGWLTQAAEAFLIFRLLGHPINFAVALCLDALSQLVAGLGFMIPAALGVQDGGNILLSLGFDLGATLGAGFSILRRFREAFWLLLGLLVVAREK
jgi:glycosyltransferase 2 family protein